MATSPDVNGIPRLQETDTSPNGTGSGLLNKLLDWVSDALTSKLGRRRYGTANSTAAVIIQHGVSKVVGNGAASTSEAITFPTPFAAPPAVVASFRGYKATGAFNDTGMGTDWARINVGASGPTATGFTSRVHRDDGSTLGTDTDYYYSWIAIGPAA